MCSIYILSIYELHFLWFKTVLTLTCFFKNRCVFIFDIKTPIVRALLSVTKYWVLTSVYLQLLGNISRNVLSETM